MAYKDDKKFSAEDFLSFEAIDDLFNSENKYYLKDIDTNDANGYTPLCAAILNNADPLMLLYLTAADVASSEQSINKDNCLPKEFRFSYNSDKNQEFIPTPQLPKCASITKQCGKGKTPLQVAIMAGNATAIKTLLGKHEVTLDAQEYVGNASYGYYKKLIYYDDSCQPIYETDSEGNPTDGYKYYKIKIKLYEDYYNSPGNDEKIAISNKDILSAASMPTSDILDALADKYTINKIKIDSMDERLNAWNNDDFNDLHDTPMIVAAKAQCYDSIKTIIKCITGTYSLAPIADDKGSVAKAVWHRNLTEPGGVEDTCVNDIAAENNDEGLKEVLAPYCHIIENKDSDDYPPPASTASGTYPSNLSDPSVTAEASQVGSDGNNLSVKIEKSANNTKAVVKVFEKDNDEPVAVSQELTADESGDISLDNIQSSSGNILGKVKLNGKIKFTDIPNEEGVTIQLSGGKDYLEGYLKDLDRLTVDEFLVSAFKLKDDHSIAKFTFDSLRNNEDSKEVNIFNLPNDSGTSDDDLLLFSSYEYDYANTADSSSNSDSEEITEDNSEESENESEESDNVDRSKYKNILSIINENLNIVDEDNESEDTVTLYDLIKDHIGDLPASARSGHSFKRDFCTETEDVTEGQACYNLINKLYSDGTLDSLDNGLNYINVLSDIEGDSNDKLPSDFHRKVGTLKRCNSNTVSFKTEYLYLANFKSSHYIEPINLWISPSIKPEDIDSDIYSPYGVSELNEDNRYKDVELYTLDSDGNPVIIRPTHFTIDSYNGITVKFRTKDNREVNASQNNNAIIAKIKTEVEIQNESDDGEIDSEENNNNSEEVQYEIVTKSYDLENSGIYEINDTNVWWRQSKPLYKLLRGKAISEAVKENVAGIEFEVDNPNLKEGEDTGLSIKLLSKPDSNVTVTLGANNSTRLQISDNDIVFAPEEWETEKRVILTALHDDIAYGDIEATVTITPSGDYNYDNLTPEDFIVSIQEIDEVGLVYDSSPVHLVEGGGHVTVQFNLKSKPLNNVTVSFNYDSNLLTASHESLAFTSEDWNEPQGIEFEAVNNYVDNDTVNTQITISVSSEDSSYIFTEEPLSVVIENEDEAGVDYITDTIELTEGDDPVTHDFVLLSQPDSVVILNFSSSNTDRLTVTPSLTFTPSNWNITQQITLTPAADNVIDEADVDVTVSVAVSSTDSKYNSLELNPFTVTVNDNDSAGVTHSIKPITLYEDTSNLNHAATRSFRLRTQPTSDVVISFTASAYADRLTISPSSLVFTRDNWKVYQNVEFSAINNYTDDDDITTTVNATVTSSDTYYNNIATTPLSVTVIDNDTAGLDYDSDSISLGEGNSKSLEFKLTSKPASNVILRFTSSKPSYLTVTPSLTFTNSNWNDPQPITITALSNSIVTGNSTAYVSIVVESTDSKYSSFNQEPILISILDDDHVGLSYSTTKLTLTEGTQSYRKFKLLSQPISDVTLKLSSDKSTRIGISPSTVKFTPYDWNNDHSVTFIAKEDTSINGDVSAIISATMSSSDTSYNNKSYLLFTLKVTDNDKPVTSTATVEFTDSYGLKNLILPSPITGNVNTTAKLPTLSTVNYSSTSGIKYVATGWKIGGINYGFGDSYTFKENTTASLVCTIKAITITYNVTYPNETSTKSYTVSAKSGDRITLPYINIVPKTSGRPGSSTIKVTDPYKTPAGILWTPSSWVISGSPYSFGYTVVIYDNTTVSLKWVKKNVTLTYKKGSTYSSLNIALPSSVTKPSGTNITLATPSKSEYTGSDGIKYTPKKWLINGAQWDFGKTFTLKEDTIAYLEFSKEVLTLTFKNLYTKLHPTLNGQSLPVTRSYYKGSTVYLIEPDTTDLVEDGTNDIYEAIYWKINGALYNFDDQYVINGNAEAYLIFQSVGTTSFGKLAFVTSMFPINTEFPTTAYNAYCDSHSIAESDRVYKVNKKYKDDDIYDVD